MFSLQIAQAQYDFLSSDNAGTIRLLVFKKCSKINVHEFS